MQGCFIDTFNQIITLSQLHETHCVYAWISNHIFKLEITGPSEFKIFKLHSFTSKSGDDVDNPDPDAWSMRACLVTHNNSLIRLGGQKKFFDHLNAGPAHDYARFSTLNDVKDQASSKFSFLNITFSLAWK